MFTSCMAKPTALHSRQRVCMQKLFLTEGNPTVELSQESNNALEKMRPSDTKNEDVADSGEVNVESASLQKM